MPYPLELPTNKHDLVGPHLQSEDGPGETLPVEDAFSSTSKFFETLESGGHRPGSRVAAVYTYPDGPTAPGPLSRALFIIGFAGCSLSKIRDLISDNDNLPPCLHKCTVAVKLADKSHIARLAERDVSNSYKFAKLMSRLRKEDEVAILGLDKHRRFGILRPMEVEMEGSSSEGDYTAEDFAAVCYVGNLEELKEFVSGNGAENTLDSPAHQTSTGQSSALWQPPGTEQDISTGFGEPESANDLWQPPGTDNMETEGFNSWQPPLEGQSSGQKRKRCDSDDSTGANREFHKDSGAAAADRFYSGLKRDLDTRADSRLYHMRSFNGWVKATQIQELGPRSHGSGGTKPGGPLRVLDLACGKGGDLGKWVLHKRRIGNYVGIDVARGSLHDAAIRARRMRNRLKRCTFTCADLGADVPGRPRSRNCKKLQNLLSWSLQSESDYESGDPEFTMVPGGGISTDDKFDVVSIQFAIHYMMSTRARARRFFQTVSQLLEIGGNLIATTIDARVVLEHLMNLGADFHFEDDKGTESETEDVGTVISVGDGVCRINFEGDAVRRIFQARDEDDTEGLFGLQYTFTLVEGSDHAAGVGDAVNLAEWLTPIPALTSLATEAGLELEYAQNFHEFYANRRDPSSFPDAHTALYNMKVLDRHGSVSKEEWEVSRLYAALKFRKVRESDIILDAVSDDEEKEEDLRETRVQETTNRTDTSPMTCKLFPVAMMKAKKEVGEDRWQSLSNEEKNSLTQQKLDELRKS